MGATLKIAPKETQSEEEVTKYIDDEIKEKTETEHASKISVDLEEGLGSILQLDQLDSARSFEEITVRRSNPRLDIHQDFQRSGRINLTRNIGVFSLALFGSVVCMSTAYVVANGNITNRNIQQNANSAGSGSILLANAPGDRDKTDARIISNSESSYDSYEQYNYENNNPQAPPTYDFVEDDYVYSQNWTDTNDEKSNKTKNYEIENDPNDEDLSYDEAYIRAHLPISPERPANTTSTSGAEQVETTTTPTQNQSTTTVTAN